MGWNHQLAQHLELLSGGPSSNTSQRHCHGIYLDLEKRQLCGPGLVDFFWSKLILLSFTFLIYFLKKTNVFCNYLWFHSGHQTLIFQDFRHSLRIIWDMLGPSSERMWFESLYFAGLFFFLVLKMTPVLKDFRILREDESDEFSPLITWHHQKGGWNHHFIVLPSLKLT